MKITIPDDYTDSVRKLQCFAMLSGHDVTILNRSEKDPALLAKELQDTEVLVLIRERTLITEALLSKLPNLRLISQTGKISNHLDLAACIRYKVAVAEGVGSPVAPAELAWALLMNTIRQIPQSIQSMKNGHWQATMGTTVSGSTIGIWGYGKIGQRMAKYAKAFGAKVLVWGSEASRQKAVTDGFEAAVSRGEFFSTADVITLHLRLNEVTFGIVKKEDLALMKTTAAFINTARAELVEEGGLAASLTTDCILNINLGKRIVTFVTYHHNINYFLC